MWCSLSGLETNPEFEKAFWGLGNVGTMNKSALLRKDGERDMEFVGSASSTFRCSTRVYSNSKGCLVESCIRLCEYHSPPCEYPNTPRVILGYSPEPCACINKLLISLVLYSCLVGEEKAAGGKMPLARPHGCRRLAPLWWGTPPTILGKVGSELQADMDLHSHNARPTLSTMGFQSFIVSRSTRKSARIIYPICKDCMAEAVALASGIAGLLSLAIEITKISHRYVSSFKGASKAVQSYFRELSALQGSLVQLQRIAEDPENEEQTGFLRSTVGVDECHKELDGIRQKLQKRTADRAFPSTLNRLTWPFVEDETCRLVKTLHRYQALFSSALSADSLYICLLSCSHDPELLR
jgi:hypothetical protein